MASQKTEILAPENTVQPVNPVGEVLVETGSKRGRKRRKAHVTYKDLTTAISVHLPANNIIVDVPGTRVGLANKLYVPAMMMFNIVEGIVAQIYVSMKKGEAPPNVKYLKDLVVLLDETRDLAEKAWAMGDAESDPAKRNAQRDTLDNTIKSVVNIKTAFFGDKKPEEVNMDDVFDALRALEVEAVDVVAKAKKAAPAGDGEPSKGILEDS